MLRPLWEPAAFDRLKRLAEDNPGLRAGLIYSVETLALELADRADTWGESRDGPYRLGYVGILWVFVRVDPGRGVVWIVDVRLQVRRPPAA
ncbi:MAG: hypothetical protein K2X87_32760 [Gemmataceae bacterium]|nr:hypothetical protein [Gemmataceae bacterium]